ncbi:hypothetical protein [Enterobacter hormaechei]|uniref:hypothetical protein n=1 Tax=Enterobacter hormaechei TaxID=158836 RepID=UPI001E51306C|nr:hypothetical protein [Enterobacter hormaechei]MCD0241735.1 hypothetical protein [Enterobacter hormaechei]
MSTITKERLEQLANFRGAPVTRQEEQELARIALASLEAEPVGEVSEQRDGLVMDGTVDLGGASTHRIIKGASKMKRLPLGTKFYTAPPAPVSVPDAMEMDDDFDSAFEHGKAVGWNAYRAAMLQGADGNSPVIPDGSEDTKRLDWLDAQNKRLNEYYGTTYGWKFDANFQRNAMMLNDSNYPVMNVRQAIDAAIAAAPQQGA